MRFFVKYVEVFLSTVADYTFFTVHNDTSPNISLYCVPVERDYAENAARTAKSGIINAYLQEIGNRKTLYAMHEDFSDESIMQALSHSEYIVFRGYGQPGIMYYTETRSEDECTFTARDLHDLPEVYDSYMSDIELLIFGSCYSGVGEDDDQNTYGNNTGSINNLVDEAAARGAKVVIGFTKVVNKDLINAWLESFIPLFTQYQKGNSEFLSVQDICDSIFFDVNNSVNHTIGYDDLIPYIYEINN